MLGCASWVLEASPRKCSWLNPNAASIGGLGILLNQKYAKLVTEHRALYDNKVVWIKMEGVEGKKIRIACVYVPNIPSERRYLWHVITIRKPRQK